MAAIEAERPKEWAQPLEIEGVPNLYRITPWLYRSGQPSAAGMKNLEKFGIRTIIDLRAFNSDATEARDTSLRLRRIGMLTWHVTDDHVVEVMRTLQRTGDGPFLIHCHHGSDRTGLLSAMFRVLVQNWSKEDALTELLQGGYGFHRIWRGIPRYLRSANRDKLRDEIGGTSTQPRIQPELHEPDDGRAHEIMGEEVRAAGLLTD